MDSTTGGILGIFGFLISGCGAIYAAVNHKKIRFKCCGKDLDMSVDIDETVVKPKKKGSKDKMKGNESKQDEESQPEQSPSEETEEETVEETVEETAEEVVVPVKKQNKKIVPPPPPIRGQRSSKVAHYEEET